MKKNIELSDFVNFCSGEKKVKLCSKDREAVQKGRHILEEISASRDVYGINTGVGPFFSEKILPKDEGEFQARLVRSHAMGTGDFISEQESRGMMFLLINMLRKGHSGISLETLEALVRLFNHGIVPAIPCQGSLGASGDLAPLAHLALVLIGEGEALAGKEKVRPITLKSGEGLALINGTHFMASILGLVVHEADQLIKRAHFISAMTLLALGANRDAFREEIHIRRPHPGQMDSARSIREFLKNKSEVHNPRLQDGYSLRCIPQVHGMAKETLCFVKKIVEIEINSVTGNPIIVDGKVFHGGNFHGDPLASAADFLSIELTKLGGISERRVERLLNPALSNGLPPFLAPDSDKGDFGMMISQYTAAALVSENKTLSHPASVDSISVSGGQEDFVSMGAWAVRKAKKVLENTKKVLDIEFLAASRALEFREANSERM